MASVSGIIFKIDRFAIHDGPGVRTLIFMKGCPLRCAWCSNPESQNVQREVLFNIEKCTRCGKCLEPRELDLEMNIPHPDKEHGYDKYFQRINRCLPGALSVCGESVMVPQLMKTVDKDAVYYLTGGGVTLSGGEVLIQPEFCTELLRQCKERGYHTLIETCGYGSREAVISILKYTDMIYYDIKHMNVVKHFEGTQMDNSLIIENLKFIDKLNKPIVLRVPLIPGYNDDDNNIRCLGELARLLNNVNEIHLLPYHDFGIDKYEKLGRKYELTSDKVDEQQLAGIAGRLAHYVEVVRIGGS